MRKKTVCALLLLLATAVPAFAEDKSSASSAIDLERIVVTPSRVDRSLSDVAASVSVVTDEDIKNSNAKIVPDALKNLEGIYAYDPSGVGAGGVVNMRGFYGGMSSHQLVLIDGVPQNKGSDKLVNWDLIPVENIERVEVMRGPASSLYGDNAMSGVINIITKKPSDAPHAEVSFTYGTYATQNYTSYLSGTFNRVAYNLGVSSRLTNGFREHADYENIQVYGKTDWSINESHDLKFSFDYSAKTQGTFPWALSAAQIAQNRRQARPGTESDSSGTDDFSLDLAHNWNIGTSSDLQTLFYYRFTGMESFYTSGTSQNTTREQKQAENTYGLPIRLNTVLNILGMDHSVVTGIDLEQNGFNYEQNRAPFQQRQGAPTSSYYITKNRAGPYLQDEIKVMEALKVICGVRYDWVKFIFDNRIVESNSQDKLMSKVTPSCGIVYSYLKDSEFYCTYGQAFRTPTISQMFTYGGSSNTNLLPEDATNYEFGVRHRFNEDVKANVSVYWMKVNNEIWYDNATRRYQNYGRTFHDGVEVGTDCRVVEGFKVFGNYTYTRAVDDSDGAFKNKFLTNVPINKGTIGANMCTSSGLSAYISSTWIGKAYIDTANVDVLGHYNTVDVKISYKYKWLEVYAAAYNVLDKLCNSSGYKSARVNYFTPEPGRTFEGGVKGDF